MKDDIKSLCSQLGIDHSLIVLKKLSEFREGKCRGGPASEVQKIRFNFYCRKRMRLLQIIEDVMVDFMTNTPHEAKVSERKAHHRPGILPQKAVDVSGMVKHYTPHTAHNKLRPQVVLPDLLNPRQGSLGSLTTSFDSRNGLKKCNFLKSFNTTQQDKLRHSMENKQFEKYSKKLKIPSLIFKNDMEMKVKEQKVLKDFDIQQKRVSQRAKERIKERQLLEDRRMRSQELRYRIDEHEEHRKQVCDKKEEIMTKREQGLRDQQVCLDERLREINEESERKKRQHEKDMLILDLTKMKLKEKSIDK